MSAAPRRELQRCQILIFLCMPLDYICNCLDLLSSWYNNICCWRLKSRVWNNPKKVWNVLENYNNSSSRIAGAESVFLSKKTLLWQAVVSWKCHSWSCRNTHRVQGHRTILHLLIKNIQFAPNECLPSFYAMKIFWDQVSTCRLLHVCRYNPHWWVVYWGVALPLWVFLQNWQCVSWCWWTSSCNKPLEIN